jgi:hypothetical protein
MQKSTKLLYLFFTCMHMINIHLLPWAVLMYKLLNTIYIRLINKTMLQNPATCRWSSASGARGVPPASARQSGQLEWELSQVSTQATWNKWKHSGKTRTCSASLNSHKHTAHVSPSNSLEYRIMEINCAIIELLVLLDPPSSCRLVWIWWWGPWCPWSGGPVARLWLHQPTSN